MQPSFHKLKILTTRTYTALGMWRLGQKYKRRSTYHLPKYLNAANQENKLLHKICSILLLCLVCHHLNWKAWFRFKFWDSSEFPAAERAVAPDSWDPRPPFSSLPAHLPLPYLRAPVHAGRHPHLHNWGPATLPFPTHIQPCLGHLSGLGVCIIRAVNHLQVDGPREEAGTDWANRLSASWSEDLGRWVLERGQGTERSALC